MVRDDLKETMNAIKVLIMIAKSIPIIMNDKSTKVNMTINFSAISYGFGKCYSKYVYLETIVENTVQYHSNTNINVNIGKSLR